MVASLMDGPLLFIKMNIKVSFEEYNINFCDNHKTDIGTFDIIAAHEFE